MPLTAKQALRTFFSRYGGDIKEKIRNYAAREYTLPGIDAFINIINQIVVTIPPGSMPQGALGLITEGNMRNNIQLVQQHLDKLKNGISPPVRPRPPSAAPPLIRDDGAILADSSVAAKRALMRSGIFNTIDDAATCANVHGMNNSILRGDSSEGAFYHQTVHFKSSGYGVKGNGNHIVTLIYVSDGGYYYFVGLGKHDGIENVHGKQCDKYKVEISLAPLKLLEGDTLHFK